MGADAGVGDEGRSLGTLIRAWRNRALLTQDELADRAGVDVRTIRRLEDDAVERPRNTSLRRLAEALGLDPREQQALAAARAEPAALVGAEATAPSPSTPRQLPVGVAGFTGRTGSLAELDRQLDAGAGGTSICIVSGTAGVGKTSLALHWAHRARGRFDDGELYVNLQGFGPARDAVDPRDALTALLEGMGVPPKRIPEELPARSALYRTTLADKRVLVVLDNARDVDQVRWLLPGGPWCTVIVTSRHRLSGLIAEEGAGLITLDVLSLEESRELLARRLGRQRVEADPDATDEIIAACARLPLALAIAAGRAVTSPAMPLSALATDLRRAGEDLGELVTADSSTSLRMVLAHSYDVLPSDVARLFRLLAVHPGPDLTTAAATSLAGADPTQARRLLDVLLEAHLVTEVTPGRYACHDLLRAFAREVAAEKEQPAERRSAARRVVDHYLGTAYEAALRLHVPAEWLEAPEPAFPDVRAERLADHRHALAWFQAEHAVLPAVLRQAMADGLYAHAVQLVSAFQFWLLRQGHWQEHLDCLHMALEAADHTCDRRMRAAVRRWLVPAAAQRGDFPQAYSHFRRAVTLAREAGDLGEQGFALLDIGLACVHEGRMEEALRHAEAALEPLRTAGMIASEAYALNLMAWCRCGLGDHERALPAAEKALAIATELGDRSSQGHVWDTLGNIHHHRGDHQAAIAHYQRALTSCRELGHRHDEAEILLHLGDSLHAAGQRAQAARSWRLSLAILDELGHNTADELRARLRDHDPI